MLLSVSTLTSRMRVAVPLWLVVVLLHVVGLLRRGRLMRVGCELVCGGVRGLSGRSLAGFRRRVRLATTEERHVKVNEREARGGERGDER